MRKQLVVVLMILFASLLVPIISYAQNMTASINASNRSSVSNLSDITAQGNISKSINGTFNTSLSNRAVMSNSS